jgi:threonine synthase
LYIPVEIPQLDKTFWEEIENKTIHEIAFELLSPFMADSIGHEALRNVIKKTYHFPFPLIPLNDKIYTMELFHGPTLAFKDVGAQFMAEIHHVFNHENPKKITVLVATSGDTGGAVANSFKGMKDVEVAILYPKGKVSPVQELQLTTLGHNIHAFAVEGDFDFCQAMVKKAFSDPTLQTLSLTSANSINVARWMPQMIYYALIYRGLKYLNKEIMVSVPSGNFGNLAAGLLATAMGLPIKKWIAATNVNDTVTRFLKSGEWSEKPTQATLSNAMDVSVPSNFIRIQQLKQFWNVASELLGESCTDQETITEMQKLYNQYQYTADPHGAVGSFALNKYMENETNTVGVFMETAHPIKFPEVVKSVIDQTIPIPKSLAHLFQKEKCFIPISHYEDLKSNLLNL